jgi:N-acetyl-anhydromuramyl-L-alanine amidase AmpD
MLFGAGFCYAKAPYVTDNIVKWGYSVPKKARTIDTIIIHSSYDALGKNPYSVAGVIKEYKIYAVAPHYLISRKGNIYRLVKDKYIAFHAGGNMNGSSIGIELINLKTEAPNEIQYKSLAELVNYLKSKYEIKSILGHNQVSTTGKTDPWNFDWEKLNEE